MVKELASFILLFLDYDDKLKSDWCLEISPGMTDVTQRRRADFDHAATTGAGNNSQLQGPNERAIKEYLHPAQSEKRHQMLFPTCLSESQKIV